MKKQYFPSLVDETCVQCIQNTNFNAAPQKLSANMCHAVHCRRQITELLKAFGIENFELDTCIGQLADTEDSARVAVTQIVVETSQLA